MFIELIDLLRCPRGHEESWLVLSASHTVDRHVLTGTLGCPVCGFEYRLHDGIAELREEVADVDTAGAGAPTPGSSGPEPTPALAHSPPELATMLAAYANLADSGGCIAIGGGLLPIAGAIEQLTGVAVMVVNPPVSVAPGISAIRCGPALPMARAGLRAIVLDAATTRDLDLAIACSRVLPGGRLVLPAETELPAGAREMARDGEWLVAERMQPRLELRRA